MKTFLSLLLALALMGILAPLCRADTLKVPKDFETIQAAIDAAAAGDTIQIAKGRYTERLVVPAGLDGLQLVGKGAILDAQELPGDDPGLAFDDGVLVRADGVLISGLVIRHAPDDGVAAYSLGEGDPPPPIQGLTLAKLTIIDCEDDGLDLVVDDAVIDGCLLIGNEGGLLLWGDDARIEKTTVRNDGDRGIQIEGDGARLVGCDVLGIDDAGGIEIEGDGTLISKCQVAVVADDGVRVIGSDTTLEGCEIMATREAGAYLEGPGARVLKNTIRCTINTGLEVYSDDAIVSGNSISQVVDDSDGLYLEGTNVLIEKNKVFDVPDTPIELTVFDSVITRNDISDYGGESDGGIDLEGDDNLLEANKLTAGDATGLRIQGSGNDLVRNGIRGMTDNGILIEGKGSSGNLLERNTVSDCAGDGIENGGVGTRIAGNKLKKNQQDLSNRTSDGATLIDEGGNKYSSGGTTTEPIVD